MHPVVKGRMAILYPQGFLDSNNAALFLPQDEIVALQKLPIDMFLISLKKVIFFNKNGLDIFVKLLSSLQLQKKIAIGFCDYDSLKFKTINAFYDNDLQFSLFKSEAIAELFVSSSQAKSHNILFFTPSASQRSAIAIELLDFGHNPIVAQTLSEFETKKKLSGLYDTIIEETSLGYFGQKIATRIAGNAVVYTISGFLDAQITETFNMPYHNNSLNVGFRLFVFDAHRVVAMNIHALNFFTLLASSAAQYNATICFVGLASEKIPKTFKRDLEDVGILFFDTIDEILGDKNLLGNLLDCDEAVVQQKHPLTKMLISELPSFIDATVTTIAMMTNAKAIKKSVNIQLLSVDNTREQVASSIGFYGEMEGIIVLIFPKSIAKQACKLLVGESNVSDEDILDSLAEFVNIIGGRIKVLLSEKKKALTMTLPRTYANIHNLLDVVHDKKGVQVNLSFEGQDFIFFLTR